MAWFPAEGYAINGSFLDYIAPSWSWASAGCPIYWYHGVKHDWYQLNFYETTTYERWKTQFAPVLRDSHITPLNDLDPKGKLRGGSYLLI
jgi:hypothetical protein